MIQEDLELSMAFCGHLSIKSSFSIALVCTISRQIPASASEISGPQKVNLMRRQVSGDDPGRVRALDGFLWPPLDPRRLERHPPPISIQHVRSLLSPLLCHSFQRGSCGRDSPVAWDRPASGYICGLLRPPLDPGCFERHPPSISPVASPSQTPNFWRKIKTLGFHLWTVGPGPGPLMLPPLVGIRGFRG